MSDKEKVAQWMIQQGYATGHGDTVEDLLKELEWQIAENWHRAMVNSMKAERESCAKLVKSFEGPHRYVDDIAAAIRARSDK